MATYSNKEAHMNNDYDGQYDYNRDYDPMATDKQIDYVRLLCREAWLFKADFPSPQSFYRKRNLTRNQADALIKLGKKRRQEAHAEDMGEYISRKMWQG